MPQDPLERITERLGSAQRPRVVVRSLYVRGLGLVHAMALASFWAQADGLIGRRGVLPFPALLDAAYARYGVEAFWTWPTVLWLAPTDLAVDVLCGGGMVLALALVAGFPLEAPLLLGLWGITLSLAVVGQIWMGFQWDALLIEATFTALFVSRWLPPVLAPPRWAWWLQWWLLFRLMFWSGVVKLRSGDPSWRELTALDVHYFTQPLPNPLSWVASQLPHEAHAASVVAMFVVELVLPFLIWIGRTPRLVAFCGFALLMASLAATGNYGFFQLLTVVICLPLLDDDHLRRVLPDRVFAWFGAAERQGTHLALPVAVGLVLLSLLQLPRELPPPGVTRTLLELAAPFRTVNRYGLFAVMTTERPEVILEGSDDGVRWRELPLPYKPGPVDRAPPWVAPHMPRLDWQLWFAALGTCRDNPWVVYLMQAVAEGREPVLALFDEDAFADGVPSRVRAVRYRYTFSAPGSDAWWERERIGPYCPEVRR